MIKINLLNTKISSSESLEQDTLYGISVEKGGTSSSQKDQMLKILLMVLPMLCLIAFEYYNITQLDDRLRNVNLTNDEIQTKISESTVKPGDAVRLKKQIAKLEEKMKILSGLSKKRLKELKAFDYLQTIIRDSVWMSSVFYDGNEIKLNGGAKTEQALKSFVGDLDRSRYFYDVVLLKSVNDKTKALDTVRIFEVSAMLRGAL